MIETAVVIGPEGPLYWHLPPDRTGGSIPDSRALWDVLWEHRKYVVGVAHTHPGWGPPGPSRTDLTTFIAIQKGLGRDLVWWIASQDHIIELEGVALGTHDCGCPAAHAPGRIDYRIRHPREPSWVEPLRKLSSGLTIEEVFGTPEQ